ncbi:mediator complex, subunit MED19 [Pleomassaria siparia CBS 279.74]|uniref:Mediator of RNA polymerase II transcription subunit 19 n=1 Tax=Pleomassaria siparia CBS 279.74 TaxID=1314801 RepID=A0A6G1K1W3_9PLEO|nr:mediator complex, subunit MED19 [Pleomassaria siparia CBS 279.74]
MTDTDCLVAHEVSRPHGSQNLFELYNLNDLARSVARTNPVTGEKINKLRKSYEGHIKAMQIAGKPKATKMDEAFTNLLPTRISDEDYFLQRVSGKQMDNALNVEQTGLSADFDSLLTRAFSGITSGPLPAAEMSKFKNYIGTDDSSKAKGPVEIVSKQPMPQRATTPLSANSSAAQKQYRPERHGAKRSYDESSFRGYGDGFADDNFADSTGGEDNGQGGMKKRRLAFERSSHSVEVGGARR